MILILILVLIAFIGPKAGPYALVNVFCSNMVLLIGTFCILVDYQTKKGKTRLFYCMLIGLMLVNVLVNRNLLLDSIQGPKTLVLHDVRYASNSSSLPFVGSKYTMVGKDASGKNIHIQIQASDYEKRKNNEPTTETIFYYPHNKRVYKF